MLARCQLSDIWTCRALFVCSNNICWIFWSRFVKPVTFQLTSQTFQATSSSTMWIQACVSPYMCQSGADLIELVWVFSACFTHWSAWLVIKSTLEQFWKQWNWLGPKMVARNIRTCFSSTHVCPYGQVHVCPYCGRRKGAHKILQLGQQFLYDRRGQQFLWQERKRFRTRTLQLGQMFL